MDVVVALNYLISKGAVQTGVLQLLVLKSRCFEFVVRVKGDWFICMRFLWGLSSTWLTLILPLRALFYQLLLSSFSAQHDSLFGRNVKWVDCAVSKSDILDWLVLFWKVQVLCGLRSWIHVKRNTRRCVSDSSAVSWVANSIVASWDNFEYALEGWKVGRLHPQSRVDCKLLLNGLRLLLLLICLKSPLV